MRVTLLTDRGLQQFILEDAENLQFADAALRDKVGQALIAIQGNRRARGPHPGALRAQGRASARCASPTSSRRPVWKASYRLDPGRCLRPALGLCRVWATIENLSGQDWKDVELTLVSARPVAFHQALYEAYYVTRPEVPVEVAGRLMPNIDRGGVPKHAQQGRRPAGSGAGTGVIASRSAGVAEVANAPPPPRWRAVTSQIEATDAATQVVFNFHGG